MDRATLLAERVTGIGGSDVHRVFSLEPYGCARQLFYEKTGAVPEFDILESGPMKRGNKLEDLAAEEYAEKTGRQVVTHKNAVRNLEHPELLVHVDRLIEHDLNALGGGVLELKTVDRNMFYKIKREGLPEAYILQLQHAMGCTKRQWGSFGVLWPDGWQYLWWDVMRDGDLIEVITSASIEFWEGVERREIPERLDIDDLRCARCPYLMQCQGVLMEELARRQGYASVMDASLGPLVKEYAAAKQLSDEAEAQLDEVKSELKAVMGERFLVETPAGKIHFKPNMEWNIPKLEVEKPEVVAKYRTKLDITALGKAHPELEKDFKRIGTTRPLRVYPKRD